MNVVEKIQAQAEAVGLPIFAVSLTALPRANTPVLLVLHWHGFAREQPPPAPLPPPPPRVVPGSALQVSEPWQAMAHLDDAMLEAAWRLGAWDLVRDERRGCNHAGAGEREALECRQAFADDPFADNPLAASNDGLYVTEAPDRDELMHLGARVGYVRWQFRPVKNGVWQGVGEDDTLRPDGGRELPCPVRAQPVVGPRRGQTRYHLGRQQRIFLG